MFKPTPTDYEVWRAVLAKEGCVNSNMIRLTEAKIVQWPYKNPPSVHNFVEWYGQAALEAANVPPLDDLQDEIFNCAMLKVRVDELTPGAYWIWRHANRVSGKALKMCTAEEIEKQVKRYHEKLTKTLVKAGPKILIAPVKAIENHSASEKVLEEHKSANAPRPKGWKDSKEYAHGMNQLQSIKNLLKFRQENPVTPEELDSLVEHCQGLSSTTKQAYFKRRRLENMK